MTTYTKAILSLLVCVAFVCGASARLSAQAVSGTKAPLPPQPERAVSAKASEAITAGFKYQPPPPPKPLDEEVDLRDVDKPQNEIVRLPKYTVTAKKPEVFNDRTLYTQSELKKLAMSRYITKLDSGLLNKWTIPGLGVSNEQRALEMYLDDERLKNMGDMKQDISNLQAVGDTARADKTQENYYDTFLRRRDDIHTETLTKQQGK